MKKTLILSLLACAAFTANADDIINLKVATKSGETSFDIKEIEKITFDGDKMTVSQFEKAATDFDINSIDEMTFYVISGVENVYDFDLENRLNVKVNRNILTATQPGQHLSLRIFDLNGRAIDSREAEEELSYTLSDLPKGIYVIIVNDKAIKFIR